jgi:hypothetical protein
MEASTDIYKRRLRLKCSFADCLLASKNVLQNPCISDKTKCSPCIDVVRGCHHERTCHHNCVGEANILTMVANLPNRIEKQSSLVACREVKKTVFRIRIH